MNSRDWEQMKFMVADEFSASMFDKEADAVEHLNKKGGAQWIFAIEVRALPTKIIEVTAAQEVIDHGPIL